MVLRGYFHLSLHPQAPLLDSYLFMKVEQRKRHLFHQGFGPLDWAFRARLDHEQLLGVGQERSNVFVHRLDEAGGIGQTALERYGDEFSVGVPVVRHVL
ncbi:hypothetical protein ACJQWK_01119 [Exserohilum turcicum]